MTAGVRGICGIPDGRTEASEAVMDLKPIPLANRFLTLAPLDEAHREELRLAVDADREIWDLYPFTMAGAAFDGAFARLLAEREAGRRFPYAVIVDGTCVGMTCYLNPDARNRSVELGGTYYRPDQRGTRVNPAAKQLLIGHAFRSGAARLQFSIDRLNLRSCRAVERLGAVQEGVLRQDRITWTGRVRDTVIYSILRSEWLQVDALLEARLQGECSQPGAC